MLEARYEYFYGMQNFTFAMFVACEEGFEMLGNVVFIYGLLSHLGSSMSSLRILVNDQAPKCAAAVGLDLDSPEPGQVNPPALGASRISHDQTVST
jgi:hypothetical protein